MRLDADRSEASGPDTTQALSGPDCPLRTLFAGWLKASFVPLTSTQ
jgi:hypothetical protein